METGRAELKRHTVFQLAGDWKADLTNLFRKEVELAKTELSEKVSCLGKNAGFIAAGGVLALMALLILLISLGAAIAMGLRATGMNPAAAYFSGYLGLALLCGSVGYALVNKGLRAIKTVSLKPEKTVETLKELKGDEERPLVARIVEKKEPKALQPKQSSTELQAEVEQTRDRIENEMEEIKSRLGPKHLAKTAWAMTWERPGRILMIAAVTGLSGFWLARKRMQHAR